MNNKNNKNIIYISKNQNNIKNINNNIKEYYFSKIIDGIQYDFFKIKKEDFYYNIKDEDLIYKLNYIDNEWITKDIKEDLNEYQIEDLNNKKIYIGLKQGI